MDTPFLKKKYEVLCSDLDGTLLSTTSDVSEFAIYEISRIMRRFKVVLVSARMPIAITYLQKRLGIEHEPIVCYNGALIIDGSTIVLSTTIPIEIVESLNRLTINYGIKLGIYHHDEWYTSHDTDFIQKEINYTRVNPIYESAKDTIDNLRKRGFGAHKLMLMGKKKALDLILGEIEIELGSKLILYRSNDILIEVSPQHTSKLLGIQKLLKDDQTLDDIIAFGDNYNDIEMLQGVGYSVAVGNAQDEVKAISDYITLNNTEDGVAHFIRKYLSI